MMSVTDGINAIEENVLINSGIGLLLKYAIGKESNDLLFRLLIMKPDFPKKFEKLYCG